ncbi:MAG: aminotransferase class I/II-fold pyridoxal phosphate-dependent enzyme [candidate division Zixibacteria bacterium]|nr:aminotransferase class I/II-fold pyridoxal phosphate-dependent enzyme [candidate division Zixibacteria bacterium]
MQTKYRFSTLAIHAGEEEYPAFGAVTIPIYQTSTFAFKNTAEVIQYQQGDPSKYLYTRYGNPTQEAVEKKMAALEGGEAALVVSSGMAAVSTIALTLVSSGEEIVSTEPVYGGTFHLFKDYFARLGIKVHFIEPGKSGEAKTFVNRNTKLFFCETPTNPNLKLVNIRKFVAVAKEKMIPVVVDNTFATPYNQSPLSLGADFAIHSGTKYLGGHSDLVAGVIVGSKNVIDKARETMKVMGGCIDPFGAFLLLRGLKTLAVRVERQNHNALRVAEFLSTHDKVNRVFYPGLPGHSQHELAKTQMRGFGGMVCFEVKGGLESATKVIDSFKVFINATSLGGVESLACLPVLTSHYGFHQTELERADVTPGMIRLSCGIEDGQDLIEDLIQALKKAE